MEDVVKDVDVVLFVILMKVICFVVKELVVKLNMKLVIIYVSKGLE